MFRFSATTRIVLGLILVTGTTFLLALSIGIGPNEPRAVLRGRGQLCEAIAIQGSALVSENKLRELDACLRVIRSRNSDLLSLALRRADGEVLIEVGEHVKHWKKAGETSNAAQMFVPIVAGDQPWGAIEVRFRPYATDGWKGWLLSPMTGLLLFVLAACWVPYYVFLRRSLRHLDPSQAIPDRVRAALDTLAGGLLVLDKHERIVLANESFAKTIGVEASQLQGHRAADLPWSQPGNSPFPWTAAFAQATTQKGAMLNLKLDANDERSYLVNAAPVLGTDGAQRGVLASFEDVTSLERKKWELSQMLEVLQTSRDEVRRKNEELRLLATLDPLTGCLNRRAFYEHFNGHWASSERHSQPLSCVILDVDHFKSVNDTHGHSTGDLVLKKVAETLRGAVRASDVVCRYGGEEFCILLPQLDLYDATLAAERFRKLVAALELPGFSVTASFGVSSRNLGATDPQRMLDQADKSLYVAKRSGRNRVVRWDEVPADTEFDPKKISREPKSGEQEGEHVETPTGAAPTTDVPSNAIAPPPTDAGDVIPFQAVNALMAALAYRDDLTAEHSRRVADLCVDATNGLLSMREAYELETAALLHDIGKIGIPDSILLKPGALSPEEWKVIRLHERIGVEIVSSAFDCPRVLAILENYQAFYGGEGPHPGLPQGEAIPLGARVLAIADAYDAMTTDRTYRAGRTPKEAFAELRRCAGTQFDPELVERLITAVQTHHEHRDRHAPLISRQAALHVGAQIERLIDALDKQDLPGIAALASRLNATAKKRGAEALAETASQLQAAASEYDLTKTVRLTTELLHLCRSAQRDERPHLATSA